MNRHKLVIIDYGLCNLRSVYNALKKIGFDSFVSDNPQGLKTADAVILPGVGAFEDGMKGLRDKKLIEPIKDFVKTGKPFLGICLGMQMLMSKSFEFGEHQGLNLIEGQVEGFKNKIINGQYDFKIPHIGWNGLFSNGHPWSKTILEDLPQGQEMYFVHSYHVIPSDQANVLAQTQYAGIKFCSVVGKDNIYGCQFHPEKSSSFGLKILNNFVRLIQ